MSATALARLGAAVQLLLAAMLGTVSTLAGGNTPEPFPRGVALGLVYAMPAAVGYMGAVKGSRSLLVAAAIVQLPGSILSWSGITLLFLVPAILFGAAAVALSRSSGRGAPSLGGVVVTALVAALILGAGLAVIFITQPLCWLATELPSGTAFQIVPTLDGVPISSGQSGGCTSAGTTTQGGLLATVLGLAALAIAWRWSLRSRSWRPVTT
jgi:hypothetical protein